MKPETDSVTLDQVEPAAGVLLLDVRTVAAALGCSERTARDLIARGKLAAVRLGGSVRVRPADLLAFVASLPAAVGASGVVDQSSGA